jgi:hypothetical protein
MKFLFMSLLYNINYVRFPGFLQKKIFFFKLYDDVRSIKMSISLYEQFFFFFCPSSLFILFASLDPISFFFLFAFFINHQFFLKKIWEISQTYIATKTKKMIEYFNELRTLLI